MNTNLSEDRTYAINQFKGILQKLSHEGLLDLLRYSYKFTITDPHEKMSKADLIEVILRVEYGDRDMEAFNAS